MGSYWEHPTACIEGEVYIGEGTRIEAFAHIIGPVEIGRNCEISTGVVIGESGEHNHARSAGVILIGDNVRIREHAVVQRGLDPEVLNNKDRLWGTQIGSNALIMHGCHLAHDCIVGEGATLSPFVVLGGHTYVFPHATLGISSSTHQKTTIGACAMVGMGAVITRDVIGGSVVMGNPARQTGFNKIGLERCPLSLKELQNLAEEFDSIAVRGLTKEKEADRVALDVMELRSRMDDGESSDVIFRLLAALVERGKRISELESTEESSHG